MGGGRNTRFRPRLSLATQTRAGPLPEENDGSGAIEDIQHYFFECNSYTLERARLFFNLRSIGLNQILLKDLLGGAEGDIEKLKRINYEVGHYIRKTKRFDIK